MEPEVASQNLENNEMMQDAMSQPQPIAAPSQNVESEVPKSLNLFSSFKREPDDDSDD